MTTTSTEPEDSSSPPATAQNPDFPEDAAFPFSQSSSAPAPPHFPRRPTFGHRRVPSNQPYAHNSRARLSTLSLASDGSESEDADDEDDAHRGVGNGFYGIGKNETMESVDEAKYASHARPVARRLFSTPSAAGPNGLAPPPPRGHERNRSISYGHPPPADSPALTHPPNTIVLLWAFAHLEGSFEVDESLIKPAEFLEVKRLLVGGTGGVGLGGGTLEERKATTGWREWLGWRGGSGRAGDGGGRGVSPAASSDNLRGGASLEERKKKAIEERAVPVLSCPPSILAVDLVLAPGESKTCRSRILARWRHARANQTSHDVQTLSAFGSLPICLPPSVESRSNSTTSSSSVQTGQPSVRLRCSEPTSPCGLEREPTARAAAS